MRRAWDDQASDLEAARAAVWSDPGDWWAGIGRTITALAPLLETVGDAPWLFDLGCGIGRATIPVATLLPDSLVVGVDVSPAMLDHARRRADGVPNVEWSLTDGRTIDVADRSMDGGWSVVTFQHCPADVVRDLLAEAARVLEPGGMFLFQFVDGDHHVGLDQRHPYRDVADWTTDVGFGHVDIAADPVHDEWVWIEATL